MLNFNITMTLIMFIIFIGIVWWAWSPARKQEFDEASHLALEPDDFAPETLTKREDQDNG